MDHILSHAIALHANPPHAATFSRPGFVSSATTHSTSVSVYHSLIIRTVDVLWPQMQVKITVLPMHAMTAYRGTGGTAPLILNLTIDVGKLSTSRPGRLTLAKVTVVDPTH